MGTPVSPLSPTVTGSVASYSVTPALPAGLQLNSTTGQISGTPGAATPNTIYTVTATNAGGSATAALAIQVNEAPPAIQYSNATLALTTGVPVTLTPTNTGGPATSWSIAPALPVGLSFNTTTGVISGTPLAVAAAGNYVVTAANVGGTSTFQFSTTVAKGIVLELGHADSLNLLRLTDQRALSLDASAHWVLWDFASGDQLASGDNPCVPAPCAQPMDRADLAMQTVVIRTASGLEIRDALDGAIKATISTTANWWALAKDGGYVAAGTAQGLTLWSPTGQELATRPGDYSVAVVFAAPAELRVARGAAGANVIEYVVPATGVSTTSLAFQGNFHSWFRDGERFLSNLSTAVRAYSRTGTQQDIAVLPSINDLGGTGDHFWVRQAGALDVYTVGSSGSPSASYSLGSLGQFEVSGTTLATWRYGEPEVTIVDLAAGLSPGVDVDLPIAYLKAFAATAPDRWIIGNRSGVLADGSNPTLRYLALGAARSIAGSAARFAVATSSGVIKYFDSTTLEEQGTISFSSSDLELSGDGSVLAALANTSDAQYSADRSVKVFSLPSGTTVRSIDYTYSPGSQYSEQISLSASGVALGLAVASNDSTMFWVTGTDGAPAMLPQTLPRSSLYSPELFISPNAMIAAISTGIQDDDTVTHLMVGQGFRSVVPGVVRGWIDDTRFLTSIYQNERSPGISSFLHSAVFDTDGNRLSTTSLPDVGSILPVTSDLIYSPRTNTIYSLSTGAPVWTSAAASRQTGAVAGTSVVFASGTKVIAEAY